MQLQQCEVLFYLLLPSEACWAGAKGTPSRDLEKPTNFLSEKKDDSGCPESLSPNFQPSVSNIGRLCVVLFFVMAESKVWIRISETSSALTGVSGTFCTAFTCRHRTGQGMAEVDLL